MLAYSRRRSRYLCLAIDDYTKYFDFQIKVRGERQAMKSCKLAFTTGVQVALRRNYAKRKGSSYPQDFPKALFRLFTWLRGSPEKRKVALTFLSAYRLMETTPYYDFESIMSPPKSEILLGTYISKEVKYLRNLRFFRKLRRQDISSVSLLSAGPYGGECTNTSSLSAASLLSSPKELFAVLVLLKASGTPFRDSLRYILNSASIDWPLQQLARLGKAGSKRKFRFSSRAVDNCEFFKQYVGVQFRKEDLGPGCEEDLLDDEKYVDNILYNKTSESIPYFTPDAIDPQFHLYEPEDGRDMSETEVLDFIDSFQKDLDSTGSGKPYLSRLTFVPKEGGGTRPVTPTNMFVQIALTPIHDLFMGLCSSQPGDCTFDESAVAETLCRITGRNEESFSFDWSSATDCVSLVDNLYPIVKEVLGKRIADQWKVLLSLDIAMPYCGKSYDESIRFTSKLRLPEFRDLDVEKYSDVTPRWNLFPYAKGAPMGLRSLWPVFATFHHCFRTLADRIATQRPGRFLDIPEDVFDTSRSKRILFDQDRKSGLYKLRAPLQYGRNFTKDKSLCHREESLVKGDDITMKGKRRSHIYLLLCELSGFKISLGKSVVSELGCPPAAEFSKRYFVSGEEITPISAKAVNESFRTRNPLLLSEVIRGLLKFPQKHDVRRRVAISKAASLSFSKILSSCRKRTTPVEFAVWATCPIQGGKYDEFLKAIGLYFQWPVSTVDYRPLLSQSIRDATTRAIREILIYLSDLKSEDFGLISSPQGLRIAPYCPLTVPLVERNSFVPHEISSVYHLVSTLLSADEVDYLLGRTKFVRPLEAITKFCASLRRLRGLKRRFIRFEVSKGCVRDCLVSLYRSGAVVESPPEILEVLRKWSTSLEIRELQSSHDAFDTS